MEVEEEERLAKFFFKRKREKKMSTFVDFLSFYFDFIKVM